MCTRSNMVQDHAYIRQRGAHDFMAYYEFACGQIESVPLTSVSMNLHKGSLDFNGDRVKSPEWAPIISSISVNKHLHHIAIRSTHQASGGAAGGDRRIYKSNFRKMIPAIHSKDVTYKLCKALRECLRNSGNLRTLQLNGLPLRDRDLTTLTKGLAKSVSLENLSLANCPISDEGLEVICQSVKYSTSIRNIDFTGCNITWRGAEHMASIINHQAMQRHGAAWAESLRYRHPRFEGMGGLRRITLNSNMLIGDRGAAALAKELMEDLWVKAVDLQKCGLSSEGARHLLEALKTNSTLCVLDIRRNPLVENGLIRTIIEKVLMNAQGKFPQYVWINPAATEPQRASGPKRRAAPGAVRGKAPLKIGLPARQRPTPAGQNAHAPQAQRPRPSRGHVPWRTAARAERQREMPSANSNTSQSAVTVRVTVESTSEEDDEEDEEEVVVEVEQRAASLSLQDSLAASSRCMLVELKECRLMLAEERRARLKAESKLMEYELENGRLRSANASLSEVLAATGSASAPPANGALEDDAVLESIERSFTKFHAFLDLLRDAGLGQLASMAGIDRSDLQPLRGPQPPHPTGSHRGDGDLLSRVGHRDVGTRTDPVSSDCRVLPSLRSATTDFAPRSLCFHEDRLQDAAFHNVPGAAGDTGLYAEAVDRYSEPLSQRDSGSECRSRSPKSFDRGSNPCQQLQSRPSHTTHSSARNSSSHTSSGSHSKLSDRSRVSVVMSEKAESASAAKSRPDREKGKMVIAVESGSEGSDKGQVWSVGNVEELSDNESF
ncbi:centrosomal protein of 78 kDa isoform X2 [Nelusetta ayraudi]|uniref:centrosomal protein of 78 kDa isoform X2 n=1 Tax=Nelusetta ayraudi TaxID=303726 RepID=UPI003F70CDCA